MEWIVWCWMFASFDAESLHHLMLKVCIIWCRKFESFDAESLHLLMLKVCIIWCWIFASFCQFFFILKHHLIKISSKYSAKHLTLYLIRWEPPISINDGVNCENFLWWNNSILSSHNITHFSSFFPSPCSSLLFVDNDKKSHQMLMAASSLSVVWSIIKWQSLKKYVLSHIKSHLIQA